MKNSSWPRRNIVTVLCCAALLTVTVGCVCTKDVTGQPELQGGYTKGVRHELMSDAAVTEFGLLSPLETDIRLHRHSRLDNEGLVVSGTVMRVERMVYEQHPENGASLHPMAVIESGRWQGRQVDLQHLSRNIREMGKPPYSFWLLEPDPKYLRRINGAGDPAGAGRGVGHP